MREEGRKETVGSASGPEMPDHTGRLFFRSEKVPGFCRLCPAQVIAIHSAAKASSSVSVLHLCQHDGVLGEVLQALGTGLATLQNFILAIFPSYSASVRLPASTIKLGEKLERYHTAIQVGTESVSVRALFLNLTVTAQPLPSLIFQRSESVRSPGSSRTEVLVTPAAVASKRHLFEKELSGQNRTEPTSVRKVRAKSQLPGSGILEAWA